MVPRKKFCLLSDAGQRFGGLQSEVQSMNGVEVEAERMERLQVSLHERVIRSACKFSNGRGGTDCLNGKDSAGLVQFADQYSQAQLAVLRVRRTSDVEWRFSDQRERRAGTEMLVDSCCVLAYPFLHFLRRSWVRVARIADGSIHKASTVHSDTASQFDFGWLHRWGGLCRLSRCARDRSTSGNDGLLAASGANLVRQAIDNLLVVCESAPRSVFCVFTTEERVVFQHG